MIFPIKTLISQVLTLGNMIIIKNNLILLGIKIKKNLLNGIINTHLKMIGDKIIVMILKKIIKKIHIKINLINKETGKIKDLSMIKKVMIMIEKKITIEVIVIVMMISMININFILEIFLTLLMRIN